MAECPFTPPYPKPLKSKAGALRRFFINWNSWVHTLFEKSYTMKMGMVKLPRLTFYLLNDLEQAGKVLDDPERIYPKHALMNDLLEPLLGNSVFSANGEDWARQRTMINPAFAHTNLKRAFATMADAAKDVVGMMRAHDLSRPVDVDPLMTHATADIIFRTLFSITLDEAGSGRVYEAFNRYQHYAQRSTTLGLYGLPRLWYRRKVQKAALDVQAVFEPIIAARYAAYLSGERAEQPDILESLMEARHPETGQSFDAKALLDQASIIFLAGHETSASALSWTLYLLAECPEWQDRLYAQIEQVTGGGPITHEHIRLLDDVRHVFKEALRLYPPVGFLPRTVTQPVTIRDKPLVEGDLLVISPWLIQRNEQNWSCPHSFDPDRFADPANAEMARQAWLPFGRGQRICVGAGFAQQEAMLIIAEIVRAFRLAYPAAKKPDMVSRLTLRPVGGIKLSLTPR